MVKRSKAMMYEEFCGGTGASISYEDYARIEDVYVTFSRFTVKEDVYNFFGKFGMGGIDMLHAELQRVRKLVGERDNLQQEIMAAEIRYGIEETRYGIPVL
jgi:hypothetical protein